MAINGDKLRGLVTVALLLVVLVALPGSAVSAQRSQCGDPTTMTLWAGQHTNSGTVTVWNDESYLYVRFQTTGGWTLTETHVHVATSLSGIPTNDQGIPVPGQFDHTATHNHTTSYTYTIPLTWPEGTDLVIAAHATVALLDGGGQAVQVETAWGGDQPGSGPRWWFYLEYSTQTCTGGEPVSDGSGCTPGYWRNHTLDWQPTGYLPTQTVGSVFGSAPGDLAGDSLLDAVQYQSRSRGPDSVLGAARTLLRAGTSALLNAAHPDVNYPRSAGGVIQAVNAALASNDRNTMLTLAGALDEDNNLGCPLSGTNTRAGNGGRPENPGQGQSQSGGKPENPGHGQGQGGGKPENPGSQGQGQGHGKKK
jgi:hypothetical protein